MEPIELYDILTLENNKDYTVANMLEYKEKTYLYLIEVDKDEELIAENQLIVCRAVKDGEDIVEKVTNEEEYKEVARLFFNLFKKLADEEISDNTDNATSEN